MAHLSSVHYHAALYFFLFVLSFALRVYLCVLLVREGKLVVLLCGVVVSIVTCDQSECARSVQILSFGSQ